MISYVYQERQVNASNLALTTPRPNHYFITNNLLLWKPSFYKIYCNEIFKVKSNLRVKRRQKSAYQPSSFEQLSQRLILQMNVKWQTQFSYVFDQYNSLFTKKNCCAHTIYWKLRTIYKMCKDIWQNLLYISLKNLVFTW